MARRYPDVGKAAWERRREVKKAEEWTRRERERVRDTRDDRDRPDTRGR